MMHLENALGCATSDEDDLECEGHESLAGEHMGETVYCDGSCRGTGLDQ